MDPMILRVSTTSVGETDGLDPVRVWEIPELRSFLAELQPRDAFEFDAPGAKVAVAVLEGVGQVWVDGRFRTVRAGDVALIPNAPDRGVRAGDVPLLVFHAAVPQPAARPKTTHRAAIPQGVWDSPAGARGDVTTGHPRLRRVQDPVGSLEAVAVRDQTRRVLSILRDAPDADAGGARTASDTDLESLVRAVVNATRTLSLDHAGIAAMVEEVDRAVARLSDEGTRATAEVGEAISRLREAARAQFEREEAAYLPLLGLTRAGRRHV